MDQRREPLLDGSGIKKRRSQISRRPKLEGESFPDQSSISTPPSNDASKSSSDENVGDSSSGGKMLNLNQCVSRSLQGMGSYSGSSVVQSNVVSDGMGSEHKLKKFKLKVGGVTRTIQTKSSSNAGSGSRSLVKATQSSENAQQQQKLHHQLDKKSSSLQGIPWKDFSKGSIGIGRYDMGRTPPSRNLPKKPDDKPDSVRKSKRAPKKRVLDDDFDEDDGDDEIRYLEKLKTSKIMGFNESDAESTRRSEKINIGRAGKVNRDGKRSRSGDVDYNEEDEEEMSSGGEPEGTVNKKQKKGLLLSELPAENKRETSLTTRQRALLNKDVSSASSTSQIEIPNGFPPAPSRKQKEKLSEVEQQLKKVEAAQRRRLQNEKAARESEAEAIRKILGQDSSRKKREEKMRKRQEEMAQEKAVTAEMLSSNIIRTVMGPTGTTVTFPQEMGFPKIFEYNSCSYPPPREKCAGPSCMHPYKYRDSKLKLPLCSLQCYKAINEKMQTAAKSS